MGVGEYLMRQQGISCTQRALRYSPINIYVPTCLYRHVCIKSQATCARLQMRSIKTVSKRKVKDLAQGVITINPLPSQPPDDAPRYPSVMQGVRNNMIKFDQCVVLTRVGSFYELYFAHAEEYGPLLGLKVAWRSTDLGPVAMAGFPFWQLDRYLKILVQDYHKYVAISEQYLVPKSQKSKSSDLEYERKVARVVTPGTLIDENFLDPYQNNYLLAIEIADNYNSEALDTAMRNVTVGRHVGLAWADLSTGDFFVQTIDYARLAAMLMRISPREVLLSPSVTEVLREEINVMMGHTQELLTVHKNSTDFYDATEWNAMLESPVDESSMEKATWTEKYAAHRLLDYVRTRLRDTQLQLRPPRRKEEVDILSIDRGSLRGLEILETAKDGLGRGSLFHAVRRTVTKGGSRLLRDRLTAPSTSSDEISDRLDLLTIFIESEALREGIIGSLKRSFDVKRLVQKFAVNKGDHDDMLCLARAISETVNVCTLLEASLNTTDTPKELNGEQNPLKNLLERFSLDGPVEVSQQILEAIDEEGLNEKHRREEQEDEEVAMLVEKAERDTVSNEPSSLPRKTRSRFRTSSARAHYEEEEEPWIVRRGSSELLGRLHGDLERLKDEKADLQDRLRQNFETTKLELRWTPGLGHICHIASGKEIDNSMVEKTEGRMLSSSKATRSLYIPEWSRLGERLAQARRKIRDEESRVFQQLHRQIIRNIVHLRRNAAVLDELDVAISFAVLAQEQSWTRPKLNNGLTHQIVGGRHPTVKLGLEEQGRTFVANDLFLGSDERIWIVTGPNMAGKSTFLRQNALITVLAQVGSYVPAEHAEIGIVDQLFSRIGAADDLFRDQSTFMVEMIETAAILKNATPRSLVIMDEVGRGTTPEDGTAVSFASLHHLYNTNKSRTLFATHFHALVDMTEDWPAVGRYCTDIVEGKAGSFSFIHRLKPGVNRQSHALKIAKMAGLPTLALDVAKLVQEKLMEHKHQSLEREARQVLDQSTNTTDPYPAAELNKRPI